MKRANRDKSKLIILFGSRAKGTAGRLSDTDVAVLDDHELSLREKMFLSEKISRKLKVSEDQIDAVDLRTASPLLQREVGESGVPIEGDKEDFSKFRILAWKRYLDTAKFRKMREKHLEKLYNV